jgi:hypothetical protein
MRTNPRWTKRRIRRSNACWRLSPTASTVHLPEAWYKSRLRPGESTWNSNRNFFSNDNLSFAFFIWAGQDPHASPSAGVVTGTYKIIREIKPQPALAASFGSTPAYTRRAVANSAGVHPLAAWKMAVDTAEKTCSAPLARFIDSEHCVSLSGHRSEFGAVASLNRIWMARFRFGATRIIRTQTAQRTV